MFTSALAIFGGAALLFAKMKRRWMLKALNHDAAIDVAVSAATLVVHWGTFSGVMAATLAGLFTSLATSLAKQLFGFIRHDRYYPGLWPVNPHA